MTVDEKLLEMERVKISLRRFAGSDDRRIIARTATAVENLETVGEFVETFGLAEFERAIDTTTDPKRVASRRRAFEEFERFKRGAAGDGSSDHFHSGHGTDLRYDDESSIG